MMTALKYLMRTVLVIRYLFHKITRTGSFGRRRGRQVRQAFRPTGIPVKDGLFRYHVKQFHESSCSVATVASAVNTLMAAQGLFNGSPVTQKDLLDTVTTAHWKERMGPDGYRGRRGLPLEVLGQVVASSLNTYGIRHQTVDVVRARRAAGPSRAIQATLRSRLERFEKKGDGILIAHFDQGSFVPELNIPHISPVGGYDPVSGTVTLLDVDPSQPHPYRISFDTFYKGISTNYQNIFRWFGYGRGGYIYIQI